VSWRTVRNHPAPEAWVVRTALNAGTSWWRRHQREVPLGDHDAAAPQRWEPGEAGGALGSGSGPVASPAVLAALRALPGRQREVIALRVFLDLDIATTARLLAIAPGTVGAHLSRAVATLRAAFPLDTGVLDPVAFDAEAAAGPVPAVGQLTTGQEAIR
jgi:DNA-directed RNA polymerase specialized sigma24 family protein